MEQALKRKGLLVERQKAIPLSFDDVKIDDAFRADLLVGGKLLIELKSVEKIAPVHPKQVLTYLRLLNLPLGLLVTFGAATFKEGVQRVINARADLSQVKLKQDWAAAKDSAP
jgi:iron complex transport system substrate-binding protein